MRESSILVENPHTAHDREAQAYHAYINRAERVSLWVSERPVSVHQCLVVRQIICSTYFPHAISPFFLPTLGQGGCICHCSVALPHFYSTAVSASRASTCYTLLPTFDLGVPETRVRVCLVCGKGRPSVSPILETCFVLPPGAFNVFSFASRSALKGGK